MNTTLTDLLACVSSGPTREETLARQFHALGDPTRLHILAILRREPGTLDVDGLIDELCARYRELAQPTVSYHLRKLYDAGLLTCETRGLHSYYRVDESACEALRASIGGRL